MISNMTFLKIVEYNRLKHHTTKQRLCDEIGIPAKEYEHYLKGRKTPPAGVVLALVKYFGLEAF